MANSKAKKSTHKKQTKKTKAGKSNDVVKIDPKVMINSNPTLSQLFKRK